ncbi:MAG: ATPase, T2SS/T4P/T4SS family [Kiritimatiellia bacterium]|jgi:type IV pilus assembly protein PilB|nr:ATPase, T2SS/T4P/T4SS family [Kiritimatiellia bacterium]MDP6848041.1 ATPase, T2SS/T4P/T4SS family [Kiritimatiellia bacterium]
MAKQQFRDRISDILLERGAIEAPALKEASADAHNKGVRLEKYLTDKNLVRSRDMTLVLSEYLNMPPITLAHFAPSQELLDLLPRETMTQRLVVPVARIGHTLTVALGDPFDLVAIDELRSITGMNITTLVTSEEEIGESLSRIFTESSQGLDMEELMRDDSDVEVMDESGIEEQQSLDEMLETAEGAPVIRMVNMILVEALRTGASDIHIEPMEKQLRLRYRIDGDLQERPGPPKNLQSAIISRVKIMSDLDIAERRRPQDGRFNIKALRKEVDLRVSILPTVFGEKIVMRILDKSSLAPSLAALGLDEVSEKSMNYAIAQPNGIILVTGPTGSGKTTTLYSCLQDLNQPDVNIITCEDPVEYQLHGINQVQMNSEIGLTFATALRSILRQDPDIVLVGEIRDGETAEIAIKAALTGHLVMSTLHTNDAPGAVTRLVDMGIEPFMLGSSLVVSQAQRLYRKLCTACKKPASISPDILKTNHIEPDFFDDTKIFAAGGCPRCSGTGYKGRGAIMEVLLVNETVRDGILRGSNTPELRQLGRENGMVSLKDAGLIRVKEGITSIEAALEVTGGE